MNPRNNRTIYLIRHGQTDWNKAGRIQGHLDVPLNDAGREQARALLVPLGRLQLEGFLCSDLSRARETADLIAGPMGLPVSSDHRLREIFLGHVQGLTREEIEAKFGTEFSERLRHKPLNDEEVTRLGSESGDAVALRALAAIEAHLRATGLERLAVVSHGGVIRRLLQRAFGGDFFPPPITNCVIYPVRLQVVRTRAGEADAPALEWIPLLPHR